MKKWQLALICATGLGFMVIIASKTCPLCGGHKNPSFLVCKSCSLIR